MTPIDSVIEQILSRFEKSGVAQGKRKKFGFIRRAGEGVIVSREDGEDTFIPKSVIAKAIKAVRNDGAVYRGGPSKLRNHGITHINSPVWALLHLMSESELTT